jgi:hypothetical protein
MSTEINIKKRITILEESAILTKDVNSIDFIGAGVIASTIGEDVTVTIPGGSGNTTYYLNESVTQTPYKEFSSIVTSAIEQVVPLTVAGGVTSVIAEYQTPSGVPGTTQIPGGLWQFFLHFNAGSAGQNWIIRPTVYKRDLGGIETLLFTPDPEIVTGMSTTTTMYVSDGVFPATTLLTTDRIVVRISMQNTTGVSQTVNFRTEGSQHYSVGLTTLNQVIPTGAVTSVTGTAPVVSSGGTTPAISIPQATGAVDGYLSSSDFAVFNAKVGGSGTLNYVSKWTSGTTLGDSIIQDNGTTVSINDVPQANIGLWVNSTKDYAIAAENFKTTGNVYGIYGGSTGVGTTNGIGVYGESTGATALNIGVDTSAVGGTLAIGGRFIATGATTNYSVQLQDGTEGVGKVLTSMTSDGKAQWAALAAAAGLIYITNQTTGVVTYYTTLELASAGAVSGDTIYVNTGTYVVTTTAANGLAKNGVNWYFEAGAIVNKATTGSLFNLVGFTSGGNVFGQGNFYKTATVGKIFNMGDSSTSPSLTNATFEFDICSSTIDVCIINHSLYQLKTSGMSCISTGNTAMWLGWGGNGSSLVNVAIIKSTAATAIKTWGSQNASSQYVINSSLVTSTVAVAIWGTCGVYNIGLCSGVTYGYQFGYYGGDVSINGNSNGIYAAGLSLVLNGKTDFLNVASGIVVGGITLSLTVSGGTVNTTVQGNYPSVIISGGVSTIILNSNGLNMTVSGGVLNILSCLNGTGGLLYNTGQYVSGGRLNILCPLYFSNMNQGLLLSSGTIYLSSSGSINMTSTSRTLKNAGIRYQGGKIISNGGTFTVAEANCLPIAVETSNRDIKILSAGLNTNSLLDFLLAKKQKTSFTISAIATTSLTINATAISESDTTTYNTKPLLASRIASLINASALNTVVIATYTASNDFFEVEALVAGTAFTNSALTNITALFVIENSYALNNITAGTLIQDVDVEQ